MMKKLFAAMILAFALVVAGQTNVEAGEVYMGNYSDGSAVYLLTHTIKVQRYVEGGRYWCTVRAGGDYLDYEFWDTVERGWKYKNSEGYEGQVNNNSPVAKNIFNYIRNNY